nr:unnamed protein product [Digitaria exilis]
MVISILSRHLGIEFGCIRPIDNAPFGLDALPGDGEEDDEDGVTFVLSKWATGNTHSLKILFWNDEANTSLAGFEAEPTYRIYCKADKS